MINSLRDTILKAWEDRTLLDKEDVQIAIRDVIEKTNKSYYLNMVEHELDFKKDGTVEIKAQYRGYIESVLKGTSMDALTDKELIQDRKDRQAELDAATRSCTPGE